MYRSQGVTRAFAEALNAAKLDQAASLFSDNACFVTPDATAVHGRLGVREILAQLIAGGVRLQVAQKSLYVAESIALCGEHWTFTYARKEARPFTEASDATILLHRCDRGWQLSVVAPWHVIGADQHPLASMLRPA